jgi:hypothetical protein
MYDMSVFFLGLDTFGHPRASLSELLCNRSNNEQEQCIVDILKGHLYIILECVMYHEKNSALYPRFDIPAVSELTSLSLMCTLGPTQRMNIPELEYLGNGIYLSMMESSISQRSLG